MSSKHKTKQSSWISRMTATFVIAISVATTLFSAQPAFANVCACYKTSGHCQVDSESNAQSIDECTELCNPGDADEFFDEAAWAEGTAGYEDRGTTEDDGGEGYQVYNDCASANATATAAEAARIPDATSYAKPDLAVAIPGLTFTEATSEGGVLQVNYIGQYVNGFYNYLVGIGLVIATVFIMVGGLQYVFGAASGSVGKAKARITNAVTGFVLLLFVTLILRTTNPVLTVFNDLNITVVPPAPEEWEDDVTSGTVATSFGEPVEPNIIGSGVKKIPEDLTADIDAAAKLVAAYGYGLSITSSLRSLDDQLRLIAKNCQNPAGSATCNPKPNRPTTCILKDNDPANCPHTTGRALDIWGTRGGNIQCVLQATCMADKAKCRADACQGAVIAAMKAQGFCNLQSEPWHFEKPKMSSTCY